MASGIRRLSATERNSVTPHNLARSLVAIVDELDRPEPRTIVALQSRLAVLASRLDRVALEARRDAPPARVALDGLPLDVALLREQIAWLEAHEGQAEAAGLLTLAEALLDRAELVR